MSKVVRVNFADRRVIAELPPADPSYFRGPGVHVRAKPGWVEFEFDAPMQHGRLTVAQLRAWLEKLDAMAMTAELLEEDGGCG